MRFYTQQRRFYCGIDRHARLPAVCIVDQAGAIVLKRLIGAGIVRPKRRPRIEPSASSRQGAE
jgi:hypothetical protein